MKKMLLLAVAVAALAGGARAGAASQKPNILLVHGAFADGSSWDGVIKSLQDDGYHVVASQIPLTSLADDVAAVRRDLRVLGGPTVLVGHSYAGFVITQAAEGMQNVVGLVYVAAVVPDTGETAAVFADLAPPLPSENDLVPIDLPNVGQNGAPFVVIDPAKFASDFCQDCSPPEARLLTATEAPINASAFGIPLAGTPAWKQIPSWYQVSSEDRIINPAAQRIMAARVDPSGRRTITLRSGHASLITHADEVAGLIERAAEGGQLRLANTASSAPYTVFASGLNNPRGLTFGPDGRLYVAEGGDPAGNTAATPGQCSQVGEVGPYTGGYTSRISKISPNGARFGSRSAESRGLASPG